MPIGFKRIDKLLFYQNSSENQRISDDPGRIEINGFAWIDLMLEAKFAHELLTSAHQHVSVTASQQIWEAKLFKTFNQCQPNVSFHMETSHLMCFANQKTGFHMKCNTGPKRLRPIFQHCTANNLTFWYYDGNFLLKLVPGWHLIIQSQRQKRQNNVQNNW